MRLPGFYNCPCLWKDLPGLLEEARREGCTCSLGPQYDASEQWQGLEEIYPLLDVFIPNELEARKLSGYHDIEEAARFFIAKGVGLVVITQGAAGGFAMQSRDRETETNGTGGSQSERLRAEEGHTRWDQTCRSVKVVDTTGAGDAFSAGFLYAWKVTGGNVQTALAWGCAMGTSVVLKVGASVALTLQEIEANLCSIMDSDKEG
ncbi:unnamed protein product [Choristocarpus tenellus]